MSMKRLIARGPWQVRCGRRMTIDDELRPMPRGPSTTRDLERYAGLFATRTRGMKSSAMRDLMAVIARPEVISLAGGLPDTGAFPKETLAAVMRQVSMESSAEALQYGPTEGLAGAKDCIVEVMAAEGIRADPDDMIVTAGGPPGGSTRGPAPVPPRRADPAA